MSEQLKESLSAAMDGEADAFELRRVLDEAKGDAGLRDQWHRYHLLRDHMREDVTHVRPGLREAIWAELNQQPPQDSIDVAEVGIDDEAHPSRQRSPWLGRITGMAVAASVAFLVVINGADLTQDESLGNDTVAEVAPLGGTDHLVPVMYDQATPSDRQRQNAYMLYHIQRQAMNQPSMASFAKVVTYGDQNQAIPALPQTETESEQGVVEPAVVDPSE